MSDPSIITQTADAVLAELEGAPAGSFDEDLSPKRVFRPRERMEDLAELLVQVVPAAIELQPATRRDQNHDIKIDIGVQQKLPSDQAEVDGRIGELMRIVEQIADYLARRRLSLSGGAAAAWSATSIRPIYSVADLDELNVFTSVIRLTYRLAR